MDLAKLNRLRVNAGKPELKAWKASKQALLTQIGVLEDQGYTDVLPGANVAAKPVTDDPQIRKALEPEPEIRKNPENRKLPKAPHPAIKSVTSTDHKTTEIKPEEKQATKIKPQLARGLETEQMARQSRVAVQMQRERERKEAKEDKIEAKKLAKGQVDPKKEPAKAKRQEKHIEEKREKREAAGKTKKSPLNSSDISVADIARELDIDPKVARAKLRRHEDKLKLLHMKGQDRWVFPKTAKAEIVKILK